MKFYHVQLNDAIIRVNAIDMRGEDEEMAKALSSKRISINGN